MAIEFFARSSKQLGLVLSRREERANLILPIFDGEDGLKGHAKAADELTGGLISRRIELDEFEPKLKKTLAFDTSLKVDGLDRIILVGMGRRSKLTLRGLRLALANALEVSRDTCRSEHIIFPMRDFDLQGLTIEEFAEVIAQYSCMLDYEINHQKTVEDDDAPTHLKSVTVLCASWMVSAVKSGLKLGKLVGEATCRARDMVNEPDSTMTPQKLAKIARKIAAESDGRIRCRVLDKKQIQKLGMGGLLAVNKGSRVAPVVIDLTYTPAAGKTKEVVGFVGKGITFDTGGYSIKDDEGMKAMKMDMGGAAAVLGAMSVVARIKPKVSVRAVIASTDNMVSRDAVTPGTVIKTMAGKTVEVAHTDAEGRLTLVDALHYIQKRGGAKATRIVDLATLTGAIGDCLGNQMSGLFGNNEKFTARFMKSADRAGEDLWELPVTEHYRDGNKCSMADLTNDGSGPGATAAAWFLREFVPDEIPWIHLDIAETAWRDEAIGVDPEGGTGAGVRTLVQYLIDYHK